MYCSGGEMNMNLYIYESINEQSSRMVNLLVQISRKSVRRWQRRGTGRKIVAMSWKRREC